MTINLGTAYKGEKVCLKISAENILLVSVSSVYAGSTRKDSSRMPTAHMPTVSASQ